MAEFPSLPLWTDAYLADTRHLSTQEHGAYLLLLMEAWRRPTCSLPNDDAMLARLSGLSEQEWFKIKEIVLDFWSYDAKRKEWVQSRLIKEREYVSKLSAKRRGAAVSRWNKTKKDNANAMQTSMQSECKTDAPTPTPTPTNNNSNELLGDTKKSKRKNGTRLPEDWQISDALSEWIRSKRYSRKFVLHEIEKFKNFWIAKTKDATKLDWDATARNWLLRAAERETKNEKAPTVGDTFVKLAREMGVLNDEQQFNSKTRIFSEGDSFGHSAVHGVVIEHAEPEGSERNDFAERLLNRS